MHLSEWLARFLTPEQTSAAGRVRRRPASAPPSLYLRRLEDRRVLSVDVVDGQSFTTAENGSDGTVVGIVQVTQPAPAQPLTFSISAGNDADAFLIDPTSGQITINNSAVLDFETTPVWDLTVETHLTANSSIADSSLVRINLSDVATPATITLTGPAATVALVGDRIQITQNGSTIFNQQKGDVSTLTINGSTAVNTLTIDFSGGNPIPNGGLTYDGLGPTTTPGDALVLTGGAFTKAVYTYTNAHDGTIALTDAVGTSTITYRNLEPVLNAGTVTDIELVLSASNDDAVLEDAGGGMLRLRSANAASPTFESTTFLAPTSSLKVRGGAGNDTITVTPLSGAFSLSVDGEAGTNTLVVDQINPAVATADQFRFAGYTFDQTDTPDQLTAFTSGTTPSGQTAVTINSAVGPVTASANFPSTLFGFNSALSIGRLANLSLTSGTLALNMPLGNDGTTKRSGFELTWSGGRTLTNESGTDFVIYEASSTVGSQDAAMIQVHVVGGGWTNWYYQTKDARENYPGSGEGAYATGIDLTMLGVASGAAIDKIRYVNMIAADRMVGPGTEKVTGSGIFFASGFVIPGDNGATSNVLPDPGDNASYNYFGSTTLDPDPLYFGVLHPLNAPSTVGPGNDLIVVNGTSVAVTVDGTPKTTIQYASMSTLRVNTRDGTDSVTVSLQSTLPTTVALAGGDGTDQVTLVGTTGAQTIALAGATAKVDGKTITFSNIEQLTVDTQAAGAGDSVTVDGSFHLSGTSPSLNVVGGGAAAQNDQLTVTRAPQLYTVGGVTFDQAATPNLYSDLPIMALDGGHGVVVNTIPDKTTSGTTSLPTGLPTAAAGFDYSLSLGALLARNSNPSTVRFFGLPDSGNNGTTKRSGFSLAWSDDRVLRNSADAAGEFVFYESGSTGVPEPIMVQVHNSVTGVWSDWIYKPASSTGTTSAGVAFATVYDLSDFGLAVGDTVDAVRAVNMIESDRMQSTTGFGVVLPGETSPTSTTRPKAGPLSSTTNFPTSSLDPDPIYFGAIHGTTYEASLDSNSVDIVGYIPITYQGLAKVTLEAGGEVDTLTITPSTETQYVVRGGFPLISTNPGDTAALVLTGVVDPTFTVGAPDGSGHTTGTLASSTHKSISFSGIDRFTADVPMDVVVDATANNAAGTDTFLVTRNAADEELTVNGTLVFRSAISAIDHLQVNGSADIDQLTVERANGDSVPGGGITFAAGTGNDTLTVQGGAATDIAHTVAAALAGEIDLDGALIDYTGTETVVDSVAAATRSFAFEGTDNVLSLDDDAAAGVMTFSGNQTPLIRFVVPDEELNVATGAGNDRFTIESVDVAFVASLAIDGEAGDDLITVNTPLTLGSALAIGDLAIDADTIVLNKPIDVTGSTLPGSVGNVTLMVGDLLTIADVAGIAALGDVLIEGAGDVETAGDIETAVGNITIERPVTLADDIELTATLGDVSLSGAAATVEGNKKLTITAEVGAVTFDADVGAADPLDVVDVLAEKVIVNGVVKTADQPGFETIVVATDEIEINAGGGIDAAAGDIAIVQLTDDRPLTLGEDALGTLGLNGDELTRITADTLRFGDDFSGAISVLSMPTLPSVATLHLTTNRGVSGDGAIVVANLAITSVDDISLTGASDVDTFAAETFTTGAGISFNEANSFVLDYVDGVFGIYTDHGLTELIAADGLSQTVDGGVFSGALRLAGTGLFDLPNPTNDVDILTAAIDGSIFYSDFDGLSIGSASGTEGITTAGGDVVILSGESLDLYRPIDAGVGSVLLGSALAIEDVGPTGSKIAADTLILASVAGIGNSRAIETSVRYLSAFNLSTGTINISDVSGLLLTIDLLGLTNLASGGISLLHVGGLDVAGEVFSAGGTIAFTSIANGGDDDDLIINAPLLLSGGAGNIVLQGGTDLLVNDTSLTNDIRTTGSGSIIGTAGRDVTIGSDVIIRNATGAITGIPPQLENLVSPQIAATGFSMVTFDYGRLNEFNFTALVDWSDGTVDLLGLGAPGTTGAAHFYTGNPNLADPAAPITIAVTLRSDARIRFTGYETTTLTVTVSFPGDGVRNVRIDTTAKVPHLTAPPPPRIVDVPLSVSFNLSRNSVTGAAGLVAGIEKTADRVLILREVLPDGREGTSMRFNEDKLNHLDEVFSKVRDGRYRLYLFEPGTRTLRLVVDVYVRDGKPAAADDARENRQDRPDGAQLDRPAQQAVPTILADEAAQPSEDSELGEVLQAESAERPRIEDRAHFVTPSATQPAMAASALVAGAALVAADRTTWHERVDAALSKVRSYSRVRSRSTRRPPR